MSDIFREVDEEVRKERFERLAKKHGPWVLGLVLGGLVALGGWQIWQQWQQDERLASATRYQAALTQAAAGDSVTALSSFEEMAANSRESYGLLAAFQAARLRVEAGDLDGALTAWDRLADDTSIPSSWRGAARLLASQHALGERDRAEVEQRLAPLLEPGSIYRPAALELAALAALDEGDVEGARAQLETLTQLNEAPQQILNRAARLLDSLLAS
ncbi:tetratricopeptide repeat protein [Algihabitans albus]|uniref:tetratricopeptide repeat protein n=1 Tax=Algihabitans albus TaxID=2164067 RepID=UPI0013C2A81D|nr:tetratricopeptide repeat protein [Algihabitans albus]